MRLSVKIDGLADLDRQLGELGESAGKNVLRRTGRLALKPFVDAAQSKAPTLTHKLEESFSIGSKLSKAQRKARERESTVEVFAGPGNLPQAVQQEFGNSHNAAQPFMRPAWDETQGQVLDIVKKELGAEILKAARRKAKKAAKAAAAAGEGG